MLQPRIWRATRLLVKGQTDHPITGGKPVYRLVATPIGLRLAKPILRTVIPMRLLGFPGRQVLAHPPAPRLKDNPQNRGPVQPLPVLAPPPWNGLINLPPRL